jgi:hypothetical protein
MNLQEKTSHMKISSLYFPNHFCYPSRNSLVKLDTRAELAAPSGVRGTDDKDRCTVRNDTYSTWPVRAAAYARVSYAKYPTQVNSTAPNATDQPSFDLVTSHSLHLIDIHV